MTADILLYVENARGAGGFKKSAAEVATAARSLADTTGGAVVAVVLGPMDEDGKALLATHGTDKILHVDGEPGQTMVMVRKHRTCEGDDEDCAQLTADVMVEEGSPHVLVRKVVRCDGDGNCEESETASHSALAEAFVTVTADDAGSMKQMIFVGDGGEGHAVMVRAEGKVALQCPEGDTTMLVDEENADRVYYCPEHNVPLEKSSAKSGVRTIRIETREDGDEE